MNVPIILTDKQMADLETSLNTNRQGNDAIISSHFSNSTDVELTIQLQEFIRRKKEDISKLCQNNSSIFGNSVEGARTLGESSANIKDKLDKLEGELHTVTENYRKFLNNALNIRYEIDRCDENIRANLEFQVLVQQLKNINEEIGEGHYYIATIRTLEFANYDTAIANCQTIVELQKDVDPIISYIEKQAEKKMTEWMVKFNTQCFYIGDAFLKDKELPPMDRSPIYEYYMIEKQLGKTDLFLQTYNEKREKQLIFIRGKDNPFKPSDVYPDDYLLGITAGFFYTEARISEDGFNLLEPSRAEKIWNDAIVYLKNDLGQRHTMDKIEDWITLSRKILQFDEKMSRYSLNCSDLQTVIKSREWTFKSNLLRIGSTQIKQIISASTLDTMRANNNDDLELCYKYHLTEPVTNFPTDMKFIPELPKVCEIIDTTLTKWIDLPFLSKDQSLVELYEKLVITFSGTMKNAIKDVCGIPLCGNAISSLSVFDAALNYFEVFIQKKGSSNLKQDKEKLRRVLLNASEEGVENLATQFSKFIDEMLDSYYIKGIPNEPPPHSTSVQLVMYLETMSGIIQNSIPPKLFQMTVEKVAKHISEVIIKLIENAEKISWTPEYISLLGQNVTYIGNWSTLISIPSAKAYLNGLVKMLSLLVSNQLATYSNDPNFVSKNQDIPFKAMVIILQRYKPVPSKNTYIIQPNLINSLINKFSSYQ